MDFIRSAAQKVSQIFTRPEDKEEKRPTESAEKVAEKVLHKIAEDDDGLESAIPLKEIGRFETLVSSGLHKFIEEGEPDHGKSTYTASASSQVIIADPKARLLAPPLSDAFTAVAQQVNRPDALGKDRIAVINDRVYAHSPDRPLQIYHQAIKGAVVDAPKIDAWTENNRHTANVYRKFLQEEYGDEKIKEVEYTFRDRFKELGTLDGLFNDGEPLTAEHVYLYNIGVHNIEQRDVEKLARKIYDLNILFSKEQNKNASLLDYMLSLRNKEPHLTDREIRGLLYALSQEKGVTIDNLKIAHLESSVHFHIEELTISDFTTSPIFSPLFKSSDSKLLPPETFDQLMQILLPSPRHHPALYSGKIMTETIVGAYAGSDILKTEYRPWQDIQETLQLFPSLEDCKDEYVYYEYLTKSVVKKHLMHDDPDTKQPWRVGALIPSPIKSSSGQRIWYRVDEGYDSAYGKFYYILKPACDNCNTKAAKTIVLWRSTSSDPYAQSGGPTVTADICPYDPPGYHYASYSAKQEREFIHKISVPIGCAYWKMGTELPLQIESYSAFNRAARETLIDAQELSSDTKKFIEDLEKTYQTIPQDTLKEQADTFKKLAAQDNNIEHMARYVACSYWMSVRLAGDERIEEATHLLNESLKNYYIFTQDLKPSGDFNKLTEKTAIMGDSLGGADAQEMVANYLINERRFSVVDLEIFCNSAPAIKREDAQNAVAYINNYSDLFIHFPHKMHIQHWIVDGDVVPTGLTYKPVKAQKPILARHLGYGMDEQVLSTNAQLANKISVDVLLVKPKDKDQVKNPEMKLHPHEMRIGNRQQDDLVFEQHLTVKQYDDGHAQNEGVEGIVEKNIGVVRNEAVYSLVTTTWQTWRDLRGRRNVAPGQEYKPIHVKYS